MTNSKLRNSDSAYSTCFSQVLLKLFTFLINTADIEVNKHLSIAFYSPISFLETGQTNTQQSSFNNKDSTPQIVLCSGPIISSS